MKHSILIISSILISWSSWAQEVKPMQLTVENAVKYALENSIKAKTAEIDIIQAEKDVWIQASLGLGFVR